MSKPHLRLDPRGSITGPIRLTWSNSSGASFHVLGKCIDASKHGMKIEVTDPVPLLASVGVAAERIGFAGSASVRHIVKAGRKYVVGLHLTQPIPSSLLAKHVFNRPAEPPATTREAELSKVT